MTINYTQLRISWPIARPESVGRAKDFGDGKQKGEIDVRFFLRCRYIINLHLLEEAV